MLSEIPPLISRWFFFLWYTKVSQTEISTLRSYSIDSFFLFKGITFYVCILFHNTLIVGTNYTTNF